MHIYKRNTYIRQKKYTQTHIYIYIHLEEQPQPDPPSLEGEKRDAEAGALPPAPGPPGCSLPALRPVPRILVKEALNRLVLAQSAGDAPAVSISRGFGVAPQELAPWWPPPSFPAHPRALPKSLFFPLGADEIPFSPVDGGQLTGSCPTPGMWRGGGCCSRTPACPVAPIAFPHWKKIKKPKQKIKIKNN